MILKHSHFRVAIRRSPAEDVREICRTMLQHDLGRNALTCSSSLRFKAGRMEVPYHFLLLIERGSKPDLSLRLKACFSSRVTSFEKFLVMMPGVSGVAITDAKPQPSSVIY